MISLIKNLFDKWLVGPSKDRPYSVLPWEQEEIWHEIKNSKKSRVYNFPLGIVLGFCASVILISLLMKAPLSAGVSAAIFCLGILSYKDSWEQSRALTVESSEGSIKTHEFEPFFLKLTVTNHTDQPVSRSFLYLKFEGSIRQKQIVSLSNFCAFEKKTIEVELIADAGMGSFSVDNIKLITQDKYGFVRRCVTHEVSTKVDVFPEFANMPPVVLTTSGKTAHSGSIESKFSGGSVNFLGVRFYQYGDSISRIDWKKSERFQTLVTREFENLNSTDATIFVDRRAISSFQFGHINSFEQVRDTILTLARTLMSQRIRVRLITDHFATDFGKGAQFLDYFIELVRSMQSHGAEPFDKLLTRYQGDVPAYSIVFPVFSPISVDVNLLTENFLMWDLVHVDVIPILFDTFEFENTILKSNPLEDEDQIDFQNFKKMHFPDSEDSPYSNILRKLNEDSIIVGPNQSIGQAYANNLRR